MNNITVEGFSGPFDLLLHLLKQSKLSINELKLSDITNQYISFINDMKEMNLDIASEYLVMASTLIEMKSRSLLPKKEEEVDEYEENSEEELKRRLLEYKKYKSQTSKFKDLENNRKKYYTKLPESISSYTDNKLENNNGVTVYDLMDALKKMLERKEKDKPLSTRIAVKEYSVKDRVKYIRNILSNNKSVKFEQLFEQFNKPYVVVTFLSLLEMSKNKEIVLKQDDNFKEIYIERVD